MNLLDCGSFLTFPLCPPFPGHLHRSYSILWCIRSLEWRWQHNAFTEVFDCKFSHKPNFLLIISFLNSGNTGKSKFQVPILVKTLFTLYLCPPVWPTCISVCQTQAVCNVLTWLSCPEIHFDHVTSWIKKLHRPFSCSFFFFFPFLRAGI